MRGGNEGGDKAARREARRVRIIAAAPRAHEYITVILLHAYSITGNRQEYLSYIRRSSFFKSDFASFLK